MFPKPENTFNKDDDEDIYDIILSDGEQVTKVIVHPKNNKDIQQDNLSERSILFIQNYYRWYDETKKGGSGVVVLFNYEIFAHSFRLIALTPSLPYVPSPFPHQPLVGSRGNNFHLNPL